MTIFIYKYERVKDPGSNTILERSRRGWRVKAGDTLLFTKGNGEQLRFIGTSKVVSVERSLDDERQENPIHIAIVTYDELEELPRDRTLRAFMFSLIKVSNFRKPQLNMRHRSKVEEDDLETLRSGDIDADRSLFYGLLRYLPKNWRAYFEYEARARGAFRSDEERLDDLPSKDLVHLIQEIIMRPLQLGTEVNRTVQEVMKHLEFPVRIEAAYPEEEQKQTQKAWDITTFLRRSEGLRSRIESDMDGVVNAFLHQDITYESAMRKGERKWRPHKW